MTEEFERFAVYFAPDPASELAGFAREWLGVDAETGDISPAPSRFVESPRKYGFHATLKAPMRLADGMDYEDLYDAVTDLSFRLKPVNLGQLQLKAIGPFLALVTTPELHAPVRDLAFQCVTSLDHLRAPLTDKERAKRKNLTENQKDHLENWGYPYVDDEFRFHMTLSSALQEDDRNEASSLLEHTIPKVKTKLDSICIFGDPGGTNTFKLIDRFRLKG